MAEKHTPKYGRKKKKRSSSSPLVLGLIAVMSVLVIMSLGLRLILAVPSSSDSGVSDDSRPSLLSRLFGSKETEPEPTEPPEPEHVVSQATVSVTGDILMHMPVVKTGLQSDGSYNFDSSFRYLAPYASKADLSVANLETTLAGNKNGYQYSGHPAFNCPDAIVDALKSAGFDLLLTANNHCYDTSEFGFLRTVETVRGRGLQTLGTRASAEEPRYIIQEINGIKIGMICYTYEGQPDSPTPGVVYMNKNPLSAKCSALINAFLPAQPDPFYLELRQCMNDMKQAGAEATVMFIHWGTEYELSANLQQTSIAQQLCDLGFDVIVGGHPHVVQPVDLLTSRLDPNHKTVCLYSTGNALSNQRISEMNLKTGHTEDGLLFSMTFSKYSDGTVYLENVDLLPCWVDLRKDGNTEYDIIPLDASVRGQWQTMFNLSAEGLENAGKSYDRTVELTGAGMQLAQNYLDSARAQREADYLAAVSPIQDAA